MKKRFFNFILILLIILIGVVYSYLYICSKKNKNNIYLSEEEKSYYQEYDEILKTDNSKVCTVNNEEISNKDLKLTKILNHEDEKNLKDKTIKEKVILQTIKENNISLNEKDDTYIKDIISDLNEDNEINKKYSESEKKELLETLSKKLYNDSLIEQFKADIISKIANKTFTSSDKTVLEKYKTCLDIQEKWANKENISYGKLTEAREAVYNAYINSLVSNSVIQ